MRRLISGALCWYIQSTVPAKYSLLLGPVFNLGVLQPNIGSSAFSIGFTGTVKWQKSPYVSNIHAIFRIMIVTLMSILTDGALDVFSFEI